MQEVKVLIICSIQDALQLVCNRLGQYYKQQS